VKSKYINVRSVYIRIWCQILPIIKGNDKNAIVDALILSNKNIWPLLTVHPLCVNMCLAQASAALLSRRQVCEEDQQQLQYADMLIKVSQNQDSTWCREVERIDENTTTLGFSYLKYITKTNQVTDNDTLNWLYPNENISYQETNLCSNNESVDGWNVIVQRMNTGTEYKLILRDSFEEMDDPNGHVKEMVTKAVLNIFQKNGVPNHKLVLKMGDICLVTCAINRLGLANNSQVQVTNVRMHSVEIITMGDNEGQTVRIPRITFKFGMHYGKSYQLTRRRFPLCLAYAMTYNKRQSQTLSKVLLHITSPPLNHGQLYVALSRELDYNNIRFYVTEDQLMQSNISLTGFMPTVDNIVYQEVLALNGINNENHRNILAIDHSLEDLI
jgi:ATP-dependent DNA helicase PIF1